MELSQAVTAFLDHRRDKGLSTESRAVYRYWFDLWHDWRTRQAFPPALAGVDAAELRAFLRYLELEHIPHGANTRRPAAKRVGMQLSSRDGCWRTLRALWNFLAEEGLLVADQIGLFKRDRVPRPRPTVADAAESDVDDAPSRAIDATMIAALLRAIGQPWTELAARNRAIILMLAESGMRVSELCRLNDQAVDLGERTAKVRGKGNKRRFVFWGPQSGTALARYLVLRGGETGGTSPLFRGCSSTNMGLRLSRDAVRGTLKRLAKKAGITLPYGAPIHGFRSGFAQRMLDDGVDGLDLMQLLGHADIRTTTIYTKRHPKKLRGVHRRVFDAAPSTPDMRKRRIT